VSTPLRAGAFQRNFHERKQEPWGKGFVAVAQKSPCE
jgi:hypothetical protein